MIMRLIAALLQFINPTMPRLVNSPYGGRAWLYKKVYWYYYPATQALCPVGDDESITWADRNFVASFLMQQGYSLRYPYREA